MHQVALSKKNIRGKVRDLWTVKKEEKKKKPEFSFYFVFFVHGFILQFYLNLWGVVNNLVTGEYLVWNTVTASFCQNNLVCPASDRVSISKSGFQIASPPLFFFFFLHDFEDEEFCVSTGYSNLWCPFRPVCRRKLEGTILSWPIGIKQCGTHGRQYGFLAVLLFVHWLFWGSSF